VGLPLAQNFATAMGGKIVIDEDVPRGAQVRVILPLASAE
jgi:signal transduction histidine kinase